MGDDRRAWALFVATTSSREDLIGWITSHRPNPELPLADRELLMEYLTAEELIEVLQSESEEKEK